MNAQLRTWAWSLVPGNLAGMLFGILTPVPWASPFAAALAAASGATDTKAATVSPGVFRNRRSSI